MEFKEESINRLVGKIIRLRGESLNGNGHVYYQGELERFLGGYIIRDPLKIYPDGTKKETGGWKHLLERDYEEGELVVVSKV
ncbi:hypothetical protein KY331_03620 [Candidatus Woesearchaeota archaeon]|nr:hypothetical protein [Candidatus Woesearchaeota archaeon]